MTHRISFFGFASVLLVSAAAFSPLQAAAGDAFGADDSFANSTPVEDTELAKVRGGFAMGGMDFDFALTTRTVVDGIVQSQVTINSVNIGDLNVDNLRNIIQVGAAHAGALEQLNINPGILTVIQNSLDNKTIQTQNVLDLTVDGVNQFQAQNQALAVGLDNQSLMVIR